MPIGSFFGRDRRAGQELNLTLSDGSTAKGYANLSVSVDPNGNPVAGAGTSVTSGQTIVAATATIIVAARAPIAGRSRSCKAVTRTYFWAARQ